MAKKKQAYTYVYTYEESRYSGKGILATALGGVSLLIFVILTGICAILEGGAGAWSGAIGVTAFTIAFYGMVQGLKSFHDQCRSYIFCKIGTLLCGFLVAVWFLIFCAGLAS